MVSLGFHPVHFGMVMLLALVIGFITPPFGVCLFAASAVSRCPVRTIVAEIWPYVLADVAILILVALVPELVLRIPRLAGLSLKRPARWAAGLHRGEVAEMDFEAVRKRLVGEAASRRGERPVPEAGHYMRGRRAVAEPRLSRAKGGDMGTEESGARRENLERSVRTYFEEGSA